MPTLQELQLKVVVIGDSGVGKTSLIASYLGLHLPAEDIPTVFDCKITSCRHKNRIVKLAIWDTAGQEEYDRLRPLAYTRTDIFLICFSIEEPKSFYNATHKWIDEAENFCPHAAKIFISTKMDLSEGYSSTMNFQRSPVLPYFIIQRRITALGYQIDECCAYTREGVDNIFNKAITEFDQITKKKVGRYPKKQSCQLI